MGLFLQPWSAYGAVVVVVASVDVVVKLLAPTFALQSMHGVDKTFSTRQQMVLQRWQAFLLGNLHAGSVF